MAYPHDTSEKEIRKRLEKILKAMTVEQLLWLEVTLKMKGHVYESKKV